MTAPTPKRELETQLREWGCPYRADDPRSVVWLEGYQAGVQWGKSALRGARP